MWDRDTGYVHFTGIWKALGNNKADIVKLVDSQPELKDVITKVRGGFLKIQGTWMQHEHARKLATLTCYYIRQDLVPIFGPEFPEECLEPGHPDFGHLVTSSQKKRRKAKTLGSDVGSREGYATGAKPIAARRPSPSTRQVYKANELPRAPRTIAMKRPNARAGSSASPLIEDNETDTSDEFIRSPPTQTMAYGANGNRVVLHGSRYHPYGQYSKQPQSYPSHMPGRQLPPLQPAPPVVHQHAGMAHMRQASPIPNYNHNRPQYAQQGYYQSQPSYWAVPYQNQRPAQAGATAQQGSRPIHTPMDVDKRPPTSAHAHGPRPIVPRPSTPAASAELTQEDINNAIRATIGLQSLSQNNFASLPALSPSLSTMSESEDEYAADAVDVDDELRQVFRIKDASGHDTYSVIGGGSAPRHIWRVPKRFCLGGRNVEWTPRGSWAVAKTVAVPAPPNQLQPLFPAARDAVLPPFSSAYTSTNHYSGHTSNYAANGSN